MAKIMKPSDAERYLGVPAQAIRIGMQQQRLPIGFATRNKTKWCYQIVPALLFSYIQKPIPEEWCD